MISILSPPYLHEGVLVCQHPVILWWLLVKDCPLVPGPAREWQVVGAEVCTVKDKRACGGVVLELAVYRGHARAFIANNLVILLSTVMWKEITCPPYQDGLFAIGYQRGRISEVTRCLLMFSWCFGVMKMGWRQQQALKTSLKQPIVTSRGWRPWKEFNIYRNKFTN